MAHHAEPMDIDCLDSDFDNKENVHHSNVLPCTEKGYEELDVSELNMKLRYSITPGTSPMSKSYTADDTRNLNSDDSLINEKSNLTRSLNITMSRNDSVIKSLKTLPLQIISTEVDNNCSSYLKQLDSTITADNNVTVTISGPNDDENLSLPSSSSSAVHTPEATTPTHVSKIEEGSTIIRGLKTVFNMFRSSQSPVDSTKNGNTVEQSVCSLDETNCEDQTPQTLASTPVAAHRNKESSKRSSPLKDSLVFNDDLEKELQWKEDNKKLPIQNLFPQIKPIPVVPETFLKEQIPTKNLNSNPVEQMDISYNNSVVLDSTVTEILNANGESDSEFVDCETTFTKKEPKEVENEVKSHKDSDADKEQVTSEIETMSILGEIQNTSITINLADIKHKNSTDNIIKYVTEEFVLGVENQTKSNIQELPSGFIILDATKEILNPHDPNEGVKSDQIENNFGLVCEYGSAETASKFQFQNIETPTLIKLERTAADIEQETVNSQMNATAPCMDEISLLEQKLLAGSMVIDNLNTSNEIIQTDLSNFEVEAEQFRLENVDNINKPNDVRTETECIVPKIEGELNKEEIKAAGKKHRSFSVNSEEINTEKDTVKSFCQNRASKKIGEVPEQTQLPKFAEDHLIQALAPSDLLAAKPVDIQSHDFDLGHNIPEKLDTVTTDVELDVTTTLESTNIIENATEVHEDHDLLDDTHAIIDSLSEIIGESPNNSIILAHNTDNCLSKLMDVHVLPDLVNQTVNNMTVDNQNVLYLNQPVDDSKTVNTPFDVTISDITDYFESASVEVENTAFQNNKLLALDEKLTASVEDASEINKDYLSCVEIAPNKKVCQDDNDVVIMDTSKTPIVNEELVISGNISSYISVTAEIESKPIGESFTNMGIPINASNESPSSPPIRSKGYNFNFDEIDDPFATKTKISPSPPSMPSILKESEVQKELYKKAIPNRHRSQPPDRKRPLNKKFNTTLNFSSSIESPINKLVDQNSKGDTKKEIDNNIKIEIDTKGMDITVDNNVADILESTKELDEIKKMEETIHVSSGQEVTNSKADNIYVSQISMNDKISTESITTAKSDIKLSSSEQSTYYSAATSSSDSIQSKNVFNLPELDINFNPFVTKSNMRQSPQPSLEPENLLTTNCNIISLPISSTVILSDSENMQLFAQKSKDTEDKMDTELMEKDSAYNITNTTSSSKGTDDINITAHEVNTEDEDTEEGPFLEVEDAKLLDIDEDLLQFNEIPTHANDDDNTDSGELFIDAEAFEFLLNKNQPNVVADSGKESLFLKFDPLFAKRISSDGVLAALKHVQKRLSTPIKPSMPLLKNEASPIAGPSTMNTTYEGETNATQDSVEDLNITVAKPMMVVTPAVNPAVTSRNKTTTPSRPNRHSFTFTSPAMAVIDRLLSLSGNNSFMGHDTTVTQANREHSEADVALSHLRELLAEKEKNVDQLRSESKELKYRLSTIETQMKILEEDGHERLSKINKLNERLAEKTKINKSMAAVVEEYERTIASLIADTEQDKKQHAEERIRLINERDEQTSHLASMEVSFSDLHSKYQKSKQIILSCKASEETCKKSVKEFEENLAKMQANYEMLKQHATSKLNHANQELQKINKTHESDILKLKAMIKRKDMHIKSLEETLAQKTKANEELTAICDELINKVG